MTPESREGRPAAPTSSTPSPAVEGTDSRWLGEDATDREKLAWLAGWLVGRESGEEYGYAEGYRAGYAIADAVLVQALIDVLGGPSKLGGECTSYKQAVTRHFNGLEADRRRVAA